MPYALDALDATKKLELKLQLKLVPSTYTEVVTKISFVTSLARRQGCGVIQ
jgi:hypothetical protein